MHLNHQNNAIRSTTTREPTATAKPKTRRTSRQGTLVRIPSFPASPATRDTPEPRSGDGLPAKLSRSPTADAAPPEAKANTVGTRLWKSLLRSEKLVSKKKEVDVAGRTMFRYRLSWQYVTPAGVGWGGGQSCAFNHQSSSLHATRTPNNPKHASLLYMDNPTQTEDMGKSSPVYNLSTTVQGTHGRAVIVMMIMLSTLETMATHWLPLVIIPDLSSFLSLLSLLFLESR